MDLNKIFTTINKLAKKEKVEVYVVGGFVRDLLMTRIRGFYTYDPSHSTGRGADNADLQMKDIDFVVLGSGLEFAKKFDKAMKNIGSLVEFLEFDTARYIIKEQGVRNKEQFVQTIEIEFAGARSEEYEKNSRKPKVKATSLEEDLKRRDFTVNAMAVRIRNTKNYEITKFKEKDVIDLFGGKEDLKNKILRTPLEPDETFFEDPLRMLRAARFASQLGFGIDKKTLEAMHENRQRLKIVSAERIKEELFKLLETREPSIGLWILCQTKLLDEFLTEVSALHGVEERWGHQHKDNLTHTFRVVDNVALRSDKVLLRLAGLFHDIGKPQTKKFIRGRGWTFDMHEYLGKKIVHIIGRRLRFSIDETKYLAKLVRWHQHPVNLMDEGITDSAVRRLIVNLGDDLDDLLKLGRADITTGNPYKKDKRLKNYDWLEKRIAEVIEKDKLRAFQSPVRGDEIMKECGLKPGPTVGKIKKAIEEAILEGVIPNEYEAAKKYFEKIKDEFLKEASG